MIRRPPNSPLFPYTPLFRSAGRLARRRRSRRLRGPGLLHDPARPRDEPLAAGDEPEDRQLEVGVGVDEAGDERSEEHTSELQSRQYLVCRLLLEKKKNILCL